MVAPASPTASSTTSPVCALLDTLGSTVNKLCVSCHNRILLQGRITYRLHADRNVLLDTHPVTVLQPERVDI